LFRRDAETSTRQWEIIADNLSKAGFSWGCVSAIDSNGRTIDAHRDDGKRFVVHADEKLTAFVELEPAIPPVPKAFGSNTPRRSAISDRLRAAKAH
jgi:hypothetical protein